MRDKLFKFSDGGTSVMQIRIWSILFLAVLVLAGASGASGAGVQTSPPALFFTDLDSGPNSGGESVNGFSGAYVTLYGNFLGSSQGTSTVTWNGQNCLRVVPPTGSYTGWGTSYFWYQKLIVQLGATCTSGTGNFVVTTLTGTSNGIPFTVRTGSIFFAATTGNDSNSGTAANPKATFPGCMNVMAPGDICYFENGVQQNSTNMGASDTCIFVNSVPPGTAGKPKAIVVYPGATAGSNNCSGYSLAQRGLGNNTGAFWTIAGLTLIAGTGNAAIRDYQSPNWRIIGNHIECPGFNQQDGCVQVHVSNNTVVFGNELTNIGVNPSSGKQSHSLYFGTDTSHVTAAWNHIHDNFTCRAIQFHSSPTGAGTGSDQFDLHVHDNLIHGDNCDGINFATVDPSKGTVEAYNNVIYHVGLKVPPDGGGNFTCIAQAAIVNAGSPGSGTVQIYNNTLYDCGTSLGQPQGFPNFGAIGNNNPPGMTLTNNIIYQTSGEPYVEGATYNEQSLSGSHNLWFGNGAAPSQFTSNLNVDPLFLNLSTKDFHILQISPVIGAGTNVVFPARDFEGKVRPSTPSMGAYEYAAGTGSVQQPNPPTNLAVTVQ